MTMNDETYDRCAEECKRFRKTKYGKLLNREMKDMQDWYFREGYKFALGEKNGQ